MRQGLYRELKESLLSKKLIKYERPPFRLGFVVHILGAIAEELPGRTGSPEGLKGCAARTGTPASALAPLALTPAFR
jgi:hypothetical protein